MARCPSFQKMIALRCQGCFSSSSMLLRTSRPAFRFLSPNTPTSMMSGTKLLSWSAGGEV